MQGFLRSFEGPHEAHTQVGVGEEVVGVGEVVVLLWKECLACDNPYSCPNTPSYTSFYSPPLSMVSVCRQICLVMDTKKSVSASQHTFSTSPVTPLSTHPRNPHYQSTLSTHPINPPYQPTLSTAPLSTLS